MTISGYIGKKWVRWVGGASYYFTREKKTYRGHAAYRWLWQSFICRVKGHVIDGREWGTGGDTVDVWCSRCFFWRMTLPMEAARFALKEQLNHEAVKALLGGFLS